MAYRAAAYEGLADLRDVYGREHARVHADLLKSVLQDDGVHDRREHAYVVGARPVHVARALRDAAEDVPAADDDRDLHAQLVYGLNLFGYRARDLHVNAVSLRAHQRLSRSLQKNSLEGDRKSTRLNSSHANISYAVFCLKKKK